MPVPKSNPPRTIEDDLRPISLTPSLAKHLEWFIGQPLLSVVSEKLDAQQFGALKCRSKTHALVDVIHKWNAALDYGSSVRAMFVDYAKAFDHVDHSILISKLISLGVPECIIRWIFSFVYKRQQRVEIGNIFSRWLTLSGGMPQGTWLGPLTFVILIDGLRYECLVHKVIDDTTVSEILKKNEVSEMPNIIKQLTDWSKSNNMNINFKKIKEIILGPLCQNPPPIVSMNESRIERVLSYKLLGVTISSTLKWDDHVATICSKDASRQHLLKILRKACVNQADALCFYTRVIRPVLEYACPVWHTMLTKHLKSTIESQQIRAMRIIYDDLKYEEALTLARISTLQDRREMLTGKFFHDIRHPTSCLHHLLPARRNGDTVSRLRTVQEFQVPYLLQDQTISKLFFTIFPWIFPITIK